MRLMKKNFLLIILLLPVVMNAQSVCGFFLQEFYYVNPTVLVDNKIDKIVFIGKMKGQEKLVREVYLNPAGKKIKESYATADTAYAEEFDNAALCEMACRMDHDTAKMTCTNFGLISHLKLKNGFRDTDYDSLNRPINERWQPNKIFKIIRQFRYTNDNLLDSIIVKNYSNGNITSEELFSYKYTDAEKRLDKIEHFTKFNNNYSLAGNISFHYNKAGLIDLSKVKDDFVDFALLVKFYSKDKLIK